jgi:VWFA-related protein
VRSASRNAEELADQLARVTKGFHQSECTEDWNNAALGTAIATMGSLEDINRAKSREDTADRISNCLNFKYQLSFTALLRFAHRQQDVPGRALLIWIGPGWPILAGREFSSETPNLRESFYANFVNASTELREGQVTLSAVSWPASSPVFKLNYSDLNAIIRGPSGAAQASARSVAMPVLAHLSGGQVYMREKNLTPVLAACLADANSYYVLGFDSAPAAVPDEFRAIEITVDRPSATVRTNTEYYAQP